MENSTYVGLSKVYVLYGGFHNKWGCPKIFGLHWKIPLKKDDDWGYPYFRKPPYMYLKSLETTNQLGAGLAIDFHNETRTGEGKRIAKFSRPFAT